MLRMKLQQLVLAALQDAAHCWEEPPKGLWDHEELNKVADRLVDKILLIIEK